MARSSSPVRCINTAQHPVSPMSRVGQGLWWLITTLMGMLMSLVFGGTSSEGTFYPLDQELTRANSLRADVLKQHLFECMHKTDPDLVHEYFTADRLFQYLNGRLDVHLSVGGWVMIPHDYLDLIDKISKLGKISDGRFWG